MIYDCPNCHTPQEAGRTSCAQCRTEFDGPVPSDAVVPHEEPAGLEPSPQEAAEHSVEAARSSTDLPSAETTPVIAEDPLPAAVSESAAAGSEPKSVESVATETAVGTEPGEEIKTGKEVEPPTRAEAEPYLMPPTYSPPPYVPPLSTAPPQVMPPASGGLSRLLLLALPVVLILVLGGVFYAHSLDSDSSETGPPTVPPARSVPVRPATPVGAPNYLPGSPGSAAGNDPQIKLLIGRWEARSSDYYVFNADGTGSRGSIVGAQKSQPFLWNLVQKRIMLYGDANEKLRLNPGPDADTIFLRGESGKYIQYTRTKT